MALKKMKKMKKGKVLTGIPEKYMYFSEPDVCRGQDEAASFSTTAHLRWVHLCKKNVCEPTQLQELQVLHATFSISITAHKTLHGKQNSSQSRLNHLTNPRVHKSIFPAWPRLRNRFAHVWLVFFPLFHLIGAGTHCGAEK